MIKYPEDLYINKYMEFKLGKDRIKLLEKALRLIGNFDENKPIIIEDYEVETYSDIIFKVRDKDNTIFSFMSFGTSGTEDKGLVRYNKNWHLTMQKENSKITYEYDFDNLKGEWDCFNLLEVIEISYNISENKVIKLHRGRNKSLNIKLETNNKKYTLVILNNKDNIDNDSIMLENIETIIEEIIRLTEINLEELIKIIKKLVKIRSCYIKSQQEEASIYFSYSEISDYKITKTNSSISTKFYDDKIIRETERKLADEVIKTKEIYADDNYEVIQSDIKKINETNVIVYLSIKCYY